MLEGKLGLIMGVANKRSIAWAIARACAGAGARLAFTYQGERIEQEVRELAGSLGGDCPVLPCDVSDDEQIAGVARSLESAFEGLDFLVHAVAFARREDLEASFLETSREGFRIAQDVSAYSLTAATRALAPLMERRGGGSVLTLTYIGGERVVPHYNVMGVAKAALEHSVRYLAADLGPRNVRVNALSAGPVKTLAARGIPAFMEMYKGHRERAPLRRNVEPEEIAQTALFLLGPMSSGVTGETIHVDAGYHILGV